MFIVGGLFVSAFAVLGDVLKPKSFAGLFGAAPSVALATLILTIYSRGPDFAAAEARSMIGSHSRPSAAARPVLSPVAPKYVVGVGGVGRTRPGQHLLYFGILAERERVQHVVVHHSASAHLAVSILTFDEGLYQVFLDAFERRAAAE
jgi:hypothetical protein